jgi:hypothetical protein
LYRLTGRAGESVWIVDGAKHNLARQVNPVEYNRRMVEFFSLMQDELRTTRSLPAVTNDGATPWVELSVKPK